MVRSKRALALAVVLALAALGAGLVVAVVGRDQPNHFSTAVTTNPPPPPVPTTPPAPEQTTTGPTQSATLPTPAPTGATPGGSSSATTSPSASVTPRPTATTSAAPNAAVGFGPGKRPFAASSSWNTPVRAGARFTKLAWPAAGPKAIYWVNWDAYAPAVYVSKPSDPLVRVKIPPSWNWPAQNLPIRLPAGITGASGSDGEIVIIDGDVVHNMWQFTRTSPTTGTAVAYGRTSLTTGDGWGDPVTQRSAGIVAAGSSQLAGLLTQHDTDAGEIRHALQLVVAQDLNAPGSTGRALKGDGPAANGIIKEGQRVAIPPGTAMPSGLSPLGQKVFRALRTYGAYDIDSGGPTTTLLRAQTNAFDKATIDRLRGDMSKILPLLHRVD